MFGQRDPFPHEMEYVPHTGKWVRRGVINIDGTELKTSCGHSFVTCHTDKCFIKEENMKDEKGTVVNFKELKVGDEVTAVSLDGSSVYKHTTVRYVGRAGFDHTDGYSVCNPDRDWVIIKHPQLPKSWPPQEGDVWFADEAYWHLTTNNAGYLISTNDAKHRIGHNSEQLLRLNPELRFRVEK